jgi:hypothetical protein
MMKDESKMKIESTEVLNLVSSSSVSKLDIAEVNTCQAFDYETNNDTDKYQIYGTNEVCNLRSQEPMVITCDSGTIDGRLKCKSEVKTVSSDASGLTDLSSVSHMMITDVHTCQGAEAEDITSCELAVDAFVSEQCLNLLVIKPKHYPDYYDGPITSEHGLSEAQMGITQEPCSDIPGGMNEEPFLSKCTTTVLVPKQTDLFIDKAYLHTTRDFNHDNGGQNMMKTSVHPFAKLNDIKLDMCTESNSYFEDSKDTSNNELRKPYSCTVCFKSFTKSSDLTNHMRLHTGDKPYSCAVCFKSFATSSEQTIHTRIHTCDKPYSCSVCSKLFVTSSELTIHTRIHTEDKPYSCTVCSKSFATSRYLAKHTRRHTGDKLYSCTASVWF